MTSTDRAQLSYLVNRLGALLRSLNPATLVNTVATTIEMVSTPPPGDAARLRELAVAFRAAAAESAPLTADLRALGTGELPEVWHGQAGARAARVVTASADLVARVGPTFALAASAVDSYADTVERLRRHHRELHQRLYDVWHDLSHLRDLRHLVGRVAELLRGCRGVYRESLDAADLLAGQLADVRGRARASAARRAGQRPADAVLLADTAVGPVVGADNLILGGAQLRGAARRRDELPPPERARLDTLLAQTDGPEERAYLLKAFAAGHSLDALAGFHRAIRGRSPEWLRTHLSLVDPGRPGPVTYNGVPVRQLTDTTCGSMSIVVAKAMTDPVYAFQLTTGGRPDDPQAVAGDAFRDRLAAEERRVHDATNQVWPQALGTTPWGIRDAMGDGYGWRVVDDTDSRSVNSALRDAVTAVDAGYPVPVLIGDGVPRHYVLLVGHDGGDLLFYNPSGEVVRVSEDDFRAGNVGVLGFAHVQGVVTPVG